ncbi:MAG: hypothetical protein PHR06_14940, partial [Candidatus Cloacimonetes bacterium]|nr:hypothetical protein [Candidatus Cloacimonadota bacterium]
MIRKDTTAGIAFVILALLFNPILSLEKKNFKNEDLIQRVTKIHPLEQNLSAKKNFTRSTTGNNDSLLVLLIDFQEDDDPKTTGNGKFDLSDGSDYPISIGRPPHNRQYFHYQIEAVRYYWRAASLGFYDLKHDVYPKRDIAAYTLPHEMSYYNPENASQELMISRFEEYFRDAFTVADSTSPEIIFSKYRH